MNKKFTELALIELELDRKVALWSPKMLADYMIQEVWGEDNELGTLKTSVLNRVINELFTLQESMDRKKYKR